MTRRNCYNRCGRSRVGPSAYCRECSEANRAAHRPPPTGSTCRCSVCGRDFRTLSDFDRHRPDRNGCGDPATAGLAEQGGVWATPEGHAAADESRRRLEIAHSRRSSVAQSDEQAQTLVEVRRG